MKQKHPADHTLQGLFMSEISNRTDTQSAMADAITAAGINADTALANDSQAEQTQHLQDTQSPIVVSRSTGNDDSQSDRVDNEACESANDDPAASDQSAPDNSKDACDPAAATDPAKQAAPVLPVSIPTFPELLAAIEQCKGNYRKIHTALFIALYTAWVSYRDAPESERDANEKTFAEKCKAEGVTGKDDYLKFAKLAFGKNASRASAKSHVIQVAESHKITPDACEKWMEDNGGFEAIRTTYNPDGSKKEKGKSAGKSAGATKAKAKVGDDAQYIAKAKAALATSVQTTIPAGLVDSIAQDAEYTAILRQQADGSFAVVAVLNDAKVVDAAYAAHGRTL